MNKFKQLFILLVCTLTFGLVLANESPSPDDPSLADPPSSTISADTQPEAEKKGKVQEAWIYLKKKIVELKNNWRKNTSSQEEGNSTANDIADQLEKTDTVKSG